MVTAFTIIPKMLEITPFTAFAETRSELIDVRELTTHATAPFANEYAVQHQYK